MSSNPSMDDETVRRVLYTYPSIPIYAVPPSTAGPSGHKSAQWLQQPAMFTALLELVETSISAAGPKTTSGASETATAHSGARRTPVAPRGGRSAAWASRNSHASSTATPSTVFEQAPEKIAVSLNLLDPNTRDLFASAPYTHPSVVTPCVDSGRYFAVRVADEAGRKATLGIGFEAREAAFEFLEALRGVRKVLGFDTEAQRKAGSDKTGNVQRAKLSSLSTNGTSNGDTYMEDKPGDDAALFAIKPPPPGPQVSVGKAELDDRNVESEHRTEDIEDDNDDFGDFQ